MPDEKLPPPNEAVETERPIWENDMFTPADVSRMQGLLESGSAFNHGETTPAPQEAESLPKDFGLGDYHPHRYT